MTTTPTMSIALHTPHHTEQETIRTIRRAVTEAMPHVHCWCHPDADQPTPYIKALTSLCARQPHHTDAYRDQQAGNALQIAWAVLYPDLHDTITTYTRYGYAYIEAQPTR